jgi:hypothetical protein
MVLSAFVWRDCGSPSAVLLCAVFRSDLKVIVAFFTILNSAGETKENQETLFRIARLLGNIQKAAYDILKGSDDGE